MKKKNFKRQKTCNRKRRQLIAVFFCIFLCRTFAAHANDMQKIAWIESKNNCAAWNKGEDARGLHQVREAALTEFNQRHRSETYTQDDLFNCGINTRVAKWYFQERIPQMLKHFKIPVTKRFQIISYNAGIGVAKDFHYGKRKSLPETTLKYIKEFERR